MLAAQSLMCGHQVCTKNYTVKQSMCFRNEIYNVSSANIIDFIPEGHTCTLFHSIIFSTYLVSTHQ
jgi:hypothetical protein